MFPADGLTLHRWWMQPTFASSTCTCRLPGPTISTVGNTLQIERLGNVKGQSVLCLKGPLTIENVSLFQGAIRREESFSTVILDLSDVPYIDSTALGALVSAYVSRISAPWPSSTRCCSMLASIP